MYLLVTAFFLFFLVPSNFVASCARGSAHSPSSSSFTSASSSASSSPARNVSPALFSALEELARVVDIAYCVGTTGITKPFQCASRCTDFPGFELVETFNTGPLMSDSCGFVAVDHGSSNFQREGEGGGGGKEGEGNGERVKGKGIREGEGIKNGGTGKGRILVVFRGTYSIANTIVDLSTIPQEYVPYPDTPDDDSDPPSPDHNRHHGKHSLFDWLPSWRRHRPSFSSSSSMQTPLTNEPLNSQKEERRTCSNCTVHTGFWTSWVNTRELVIPHLQTLRQTYPNYEIHLVGHSLGGAVALLAGLEFESRGWKPTVTTFGEPRVGNEALAGWVDWRFGLDGDENGDDGRGEKKREGRGEKKREGRGEKKGEERGEDKRYRRVTHVDDPVPLLPLREWGYRSHAGEIYISKAALQPGVGDVWLCEGREDGECSAGAEGGGEGWGRRVSAVSGAGDRDSDASIKLSTASGAVGEQLKDSTKPTLESYKTQLSALENENTLRLHRSRLDQDRPLIISGLKALLSTPLLKHVPFEEPVWNWLVDSEALDGVEAEANLLDAYLDLLTFHRKSTMKAAERLGVDLNGWTFESGDGDGGGDGEEADVQRRARFVVGLHANWGLPIPARFKIWQLFFAHRDYFWRLGLCVPGGDPWRWAGEGQRWKGRGVGWGSGLRWGDE